MRIPLATFLASWLVVACSAFGPSAEVTMCDAARDLSAARTIVEQAAARDAGGGRAHAGRLASEAVALAGHGHDVLQTVTSSDVKRGDTWQALLDAYLHVGQAANALLPAYASTHGITEHELTKASDSLRATKAGLPARCFMATSPPTLGVSSARA